MSWWQAWLTHTWALALDAAPWLLIGLVAAGLIHALVPTAKLSRWLGGRGVGSVVRAALIGAPLPLCSCGVVPAAVALRRQGASPSATVSFLVATPETGVDSIAVSYALLGPFMTVVRPIAAVLSAMAAGLAVACVPAGRAVGRAAEVGLAIAGAGGDGETSGDACCGRDASTPGRAAGCCDEAGQGSGGCCTTGPAPTSRGGRLMAGLRFAATDLMDDLALWLLVGLVLAGAVATFVSPEAMAAWGGGLPVMLLMLVIGIPMYICATASTPVAAAMLLAGLSPGAVLVFLLAGPATNLGTLGIIRRELGTPALAGYLGGLSVMALAAGLITDALVTGLDIAVVAQVAESGELVPAPVAIGSLVVLVGLGIRPLRRVLLGA